VKANRNFQFNERKNELSKLPIYSKLEHGGWAEPALASVDKRYKNVYLRSCLEKMKRLR
jgi:hypothetical protein